MTDVVSDSASYGEEQLRALMGQPAGADGLDLGDLFKALPSGVYFAPDPHAWRLLEPSDQRALAPPAGLGESVIADGVNPHWRRVLPFPFTAKQLLQFADYAMLPELCEWMERHLDEWHPPLRVDLALREMESSPRALSLALFLAGAAEPEMVIDPGALAPGVESASEVMAPGQSAEHKPGEDGRRRVHRSAPHDLLAPLIDRVCRDLDTFDSAAVMAELERLARLPDSTRPAPLFEVDSGGIKWRDGGGVRKLTRKALGDRLGRARKAAQSRAEPRA